MSDITVVCCWNNEKVYNDFVNTLKAQTYPCEIIGIDNRGNKAFTSCAAAYNSVIEQVKTKYVIYSHCDILLNKPDILEKFTACLDKIGRDDVLGVAGAKFSTSGTITNIMHIWDYNHKLGYAGRLRVKGEMEECDTLDECFFGGYTEHFRAYPFDEVVCDDWHLYATDACLTAKSAAGGTVWISGLTLIHLSNGKLSIPFFLGFYRLCRKYADTFPFIRTTCISSRTTLPLLIPTLILKWLKNRIGRLLKMIGLYGIAKRIMLKISK